MFQTELFFSAEVLTSASSWRNKCLKSIERLHVVFSERRSPKLLSGTEPWPRTSGACVRSRYVCSVFTCTWFSFAGLIRRTPPPTFSDTVITDRHSDTTIFQLRAHWVRKSWSIGSEKIVRTCAVSRSRTLDFLCER